MRAPLRRRVSLSQGQVSYLEWPNRGPALHFAHATGFNCEVYKTLLAPLAEHVHVFASDLRGHGFTQLPTTEPADWAQHEVDLDAVLDLIHPGPLVLAGHSMGAIVSLMVAARRPERVQALILVEPVLVAPSADVASEHGEAAEARQPDRGRQAARRRSHFASLDEAFTAYRGRGAFKSWPDEVLYDYLRGGLVPVADGTELRLACTPAWEAATFHATPIGAARIARSVECPIGVLVGTQASTANERELAVLRRVHERTHVVRVTGATHFLPMERPDIVRKEIMRAIGAL